MTCVGKWPLQYAIVLSISQLYDFADWIVRGCFNRGVLSFKAVAYEGLGHVTFR